MNNLPAVTIIIVTRNGKELLRGCLNSIVSLDYPRDKIFTVVVDNNSTDGTIDFIKSNFSKTDVIVNQGNDGFSASNNLALKKVNTEFILLLNNDAELEQNALKDMINLAMENKDSGMIAPRIVYKSNPDEIQSQGILLCKSGRIYKRKRFEDPIFCPTAAAALYRKSMFDEAGLFDEEFFAYYEDIDLAWRAHHHNWTVEYSHSAIVYHDPSTSWKFRSKEQRYFCVRNRIYTILKNWPLDLLIWRLPYIIVFLFLQSVLFSLRYMDLISFKAIFDALINAKKCLSVRKVIKPSEYFKPYFIPVSRELKSLILR